MKMTFLTAAMGLTCLGLCSTASALQSAAWEASSGVPPQSADPPWGVLDSVAPPATGLGQGTVTFGAGGLVIDSSARPEDLTGVFHTSSTAVAGLPPAVFFEVELAIPQASAGLPATVLELWRYGLPGRWELYVGADSLTSVHRYALPISQGASQETAVIGSTAINRTYRIEIDTTTHVTTVSVDGMPVITHVGVGAAFTQNTSVASVGDGSGNGTATIVVQRMEHNLGLDALQYCGGTTSGSGNAPTTFFTGSAVLADASASFTALNLPAFARALPLVSFRAAPMLASASSHSQLQGLCLGRPFSRYLPNGQVPTADAAGRLDFSVDPSQIPSPGGVVSLQPGDSLHVQLWFREAGGAAATGFSAAHWIQFR